MKLDLIKENFSPHELLAGNFGIEREGLRVKPEAILTDTPHPKIFGNKLKNPYITTDFSESQVEVVTPPYTSVKRAHQVLESLVDIVNNEIRYQGELLWPGSMPCAAPESIPIADYEDEGKEEYEYRMGLIEKYGGLKQLLTGIHFNFSFTDIFLEKLRKLTAPEMSLQEFKNAVYLKIARNYLRYRWLVIYLTGSSAAMDESYDCVNLDFVVKEETDSLIMKNGPSLRNSPCGYKNLIDFHPRYDTLENYIEDVSSYVDSGMLQKAKELYSQIRLKTGDKGDILKSLDEEGIQYLEIRTVDLNVFDKSGVNYRDLFFLQLFLIFCLFAEENDVESTVWQEEALTNENLTAVHGLLPDLTLQRDGEDILLRDWASAILDDIAGMVEELEIDDEGVVEEMKTRVIKPETTYAAQMANIVKNEGYLNAMMRYAKDYADDSHRYRYLMHGYENYELSTQILIKEAITRGVEVQELDPSDNFLALKAKGMTKLVKQANKTEADNYACVLAMENKVVTKKILSERGIRVPEGREFYNIEDFISEVSSFEGKSLVIKPKSTNYGLGIFMFEEGGTEKDLIAAAKGAFSYDDTILVEEFIPGQEYRFLVIGGKTVAVLQRVPANVVGDGEHTIAELIDIENQHPFRGEGYSAPMKKIVVDEQTKIYLKNQGLTVESVPEEGEQVFLRGNSNISTGGDSIDMTDKMPEHFKRLAEEAAASVGAVFCGVDLIIEDYNDENSRFGIIELNFNPSTDMHAYPKEGKEHRTGAYIMSALGLIDDNLEEIEAKEKLADEYDLLLEQLDI